jgi:hypothetical protein
MLQSENLYPPSVNNSNLRFVGVYTFATQEVCGCFLSKLQIVWRSTGAAVLETVQKILQIDADEWIKTYDGTVYLTSWMDFSKSLKL